LCVLSIAPNLKLLAVNGEEVWACAEKKKEASGNAGLKTEFKTSKTINVIMLLCLFINDSQNHFASYKNFIKINVK
jgi:hypothetical protein